MMRPGGHLLNLSGETMGTNWSVRAYAGTPPYTSNLRTIISELFNDICDVFSTWQPDSFISRFNQSDVGSVALMPPAFQTVWSTALDIADKSNGAFNPALGDLTITRGYGAQAGYTAPPSMLYKPVWTGDPCKTRDAHIEQCGQGALDLSAIAKGYAVDQLADKLDSIGFVSVLAEIGGEYVGRGIKSDQQPWWIDIETSDVNAPPLRLALLNEAIATSGPRYNRTQAHSHIATDQDASPFSSVSVIADSCLLADGWATALYAAGHRGLELADEHALKVIFQMTDGRAAFSSALSPYLR